MASTFQVPKGAVPLTYFKSRTLSFKVVGKMGNVVYTFRHDESVPVYIGPDAEAFRAHESLIETNEKGEPTHVDTSGEAKPLSYRKFSARGTMTRAALGIVKPPETITDADIENLEARRLSQRSQFDS